MKYIFLMTGKRIPKAGGKLKRSFAENVRSMMDAVYSTSSNKPKSLTKDAGISLSSVQRALSGETAPNLDTVEAIAEAFRVQPNELLRSVLPGREIRRTGTHN